MSNGLQTKLSKKARRQRGFTLVEVLIAIAILSIGVIAALLIFPRGFDVFTETQQTYVALKQIDSILNDFQDNPETLPDGFYPAWDGDGSAINRFFFNDLYSVNYAASADNWYSGHLFPGATGPSWPLWQPASVRILRKVVGEPCTIPSEFSTQTSPASAYNVSFTPKYFPRFGPLLANGRWDYASDQYSAVNTSVGPLTVYDLRYRKVTAEKFKAVKDNLQHYQDNLYYAVDIKLNALAFLPILTGDADRVIRISFMAYLNGRVYQFRPDGGETITIASTDNQKAFTFKSDTDPAETITLHGTASDEEYTLRFDNPTVANGWRLIQDSEQLNRAYAYYSTSDPQTIQPDEDPSTEEFATLPPAQQDANIDAYWDKISNLPSGTYYMERMTRAEAKGRILIGAIYFSKADAGRAVKLDYTIADWNILHDDVTVDDQGYVRLSFPNPKLRNIPAYPREPFTWGLYSPIRENQAATVMGMVDLQTGVMYHAATDKPFIRQPEYYYYNVNDAATLLPIDFSGAAAGRVRIGGGVWGQPDWEGMRGHTFRVFYRAQRDWTLQVYRTPAVFWRTDGLTDFDLCSGAWNKFSLDDGNQVRLPAVYEKQTVALDYSYRQEVCRAYADSEEDTSYTPPAGNPNLEQYKVQVSSLTNVRDGMVLIFVNPGDSYADAQSIVVSDIDVDTTSGQNAYYLFWEHDSTEGPQTVIESGAYIIDPNAPLQQVHGEEHTIPDRAKGESVCRFSLPHLPVSSNTITMRGLSVIVRALWIQPRSGKAWEFLNFDNTTGLPLYKVTNLRERWQAKTAIITLPLAKN